MRIPNAVAAGVHPVDGTPRRTKVGVGDVNQYARVDKQNRDTVADTRVVTTTMITEGHLIAVRVGAEVNIAVGCNIGDSVATPRVGSTAVGAEVHSVAAVANGEGIAVPVHIVVTGGLPVGPFGCILEVVAIRHRGGNLRGSKDATFTAEERGVARGADRSHTIAVSGGGGEACQREGVAVCGHGVDRGTLYASLLVLNNPRSGADGVSPAQHCRVLRGTSSSKVIDARARRQLVDNHFININRIVGTRSQIFHNDTERNVITITSVGGGIDKVFSVCGGKRDSVNHSEGAHVVRTGHHTNHDMLACHGALGPETNLDVVNGVVGRVDGRRNISLIISIGRIIVHIEIQRLATIVTIGSIDIRICRRASIIEAIPAESHIGRTGGLTLPVVAVRQADGATERMEGNTIGPVGDVSSRADRADIHLIVVRVVQAGKDNTVSRDNLRDSGAVGKTRRAVLNLVAAGAVVTMVNPAHDSTVLGSIAYADTVGREASGSLMHINLINKPEPVVRGRCVAHRNTSTRRSAGEVDGFLFISPTKFTINIVVSNNKRRIIIDISNVSNIKYASISVGTLRTSLESQLQAANWLCKFREDENICHIGIP